jgi:hypothetical protein
VAAAESAHLAVHTALLVGSLLAGEAVEGVEAVVGAQSREALVLQALPPQEDLDHGGFQLVVVLWPTASCDLDRGRVVITEVNGTMPRILATSAAIGDRVLPRSHSATATATATVAFA